MMIRPIRYGQRLLHFREHFYCDHIRSTGSISRIASVTKRDCGHCVHMIASVTYVYIYTIIHVRHWIPSVLDSDDVSVAWQPGKCVPVS